MSKQAHRNPSYLTEQNLFHLVATSERHSDHQSAVWSLLLLLFWLLLLNDILLSIALPLYDLLRHEGCLVKIPSKLCAYEKEDASHLHFTYVYIFIYITLL